MRILLGMTGLAMVCACVGCDSPPPVEPHLRVAVAPGVSAEHSAALLDAAAEWGRATGGSAHVEIVSDAPNAWLLYGTPRGYISAWDWATSEMFLKPSLSGFQAQLAITHELGHAWGIRGHLPTGLMAAEASMFCIDEPALERVCDQIGCVTMKATCAP